MFRIPLYANRFTFFLLPIVIGTAHGVIQKAFRPMGNILSIWKHYGGMPIFVNLIQFEVPIGYPLYDPQNYG